jgi:hypothetical protein
MKKAYITIMYRYGNLDGHAYFIYASESKDMASLSGKANHQYRGGKYDPVITEITYDNELKLKFNYTNDTDSEGISFIVGEGDEIELDPGLDEESYLDLHHIIHSLTTKEQEIIRDWYAGYIKEQI